MRSLVKTILFGQAYSGKTAARVRLCMQETLVDYNPTIGVDFASLTVTEIIDGSSHSTRIQLWDTSGLSRFRCIADSYVRGSHLMCFFYPGSIGIDKSEDLPDSARDDIMQDPTEAFLSFLQPYASQRPDTPIIICLSKQDRLGEEDSSQGIISNELLGTLGELAAGGRAVGVIALSAVTGRGILRWGRAMALFGAGQREQALELLDFAL